MGLLEGSSGKNGILTVVLASLFLVSISVISHDAFGMGQNPGTCPNRYDGNIVSFIIDNGTQTFDAIAHPGVTFDEKYGSDYGTTFVIHTLNASSQNNTNSGTTWFDGDWYGFAQGVCVGGAGPNQNVTVTTNWGHGGTAGPGGTYPVYVNTYYGHSVTFSVHWYAVPYAPTNLSARGLEPSQINLSWSAPSYGGTSPITNYKIYRSTSSGSEALFTTVGDVTSYNDTNVTYGTTYYYKVTAENSYGQSPQSNEASAGPPSPSAAPPQPPANLAATPISSYQVNLSWQAPASDGGAGVIGYKIERSDDAGSTWNVLLPNTGGGSNTGSTATAYSDTGLQPTTAHLYRVSSINYAGTSPPSSTASATTLSALVAEWKFDGDTNDASSYGNNGVNNGAAFVPGKVGQALSFDGTDDIVTVANSPSLNFGTVSFSVSTWVRATGTASGWIINHASNNDGVYAGYQISDGAGTVSASIEQDTSHRASVAGTTSINDGAFHHIALVVDRSAQTVNLYIDDNLQGSASIANVGNIDTSLDLGIGGVISPNTADFFNGTVDQTRIYSKALSSSEIQALFGEASQSGTAILSAPQNLVATPGSAQVSLSWSVPSGNSGSAITNYKIYRSANSGTETLLTQIGNVTSYTDNAVASGQPYYYKVSAVNSIGESTQSNEARATPTAPSSSGSVGGIVLNNAQSTSGTTSSSNQITLYNFNTGSGSNNLLVVGVGANNAAVSSVTFGGIQLTKTASSFSNNDAEFWYLKSPAGTGDIMVTMNGQTQAVVGAYSFSGVNQTVPIPAHLAKHNTTPNSPNISITTKYPNDWVLDLPSIYGGEKLGSPTCAQQWNVNMPNQITSASSSTVVPSPATVTCKWTASSADLWDDVAIEIGSYTASGTGTGTTATVPSAPTGLTTTPGNAQIALSWTVPASNGGSAIANYKIYRSTSSGAEAFLTQAGNVTTYTDNTVTNGQTYYYQVTAVNSIGESPKSNEVSAMPAAPAPTSGDKVIATIPGVTASFLSVDPGTNKIYANNEHNYLVIDRATNGITATIPFGTSDSLGGLGINLATNKVYLQDLSSNSVHVIDGNTNHIIANITNLASGTASNIVANKNTNKVYVAAEGLAVVNGTTDTLMGYVANVCTGSINWFDVNPVTNKIYVACGTNPNGLQGRQAFVSVIDGSNDTVVGKFSLPCCGFFGGVAVNPATNIVYLTDFGSHVIYVFDGNTNTLVGTIPTSADGFMAVNPTTNRVYASDGSSSVSVIDGSTNKIVQTLQVGKWPWQLSVDPGTSKIYVANSGSDFVSVIDGSSSASGGSGTTGMTLNNIQSTSGTTSSNRITLSNFNTGTGTNQLLVVGISANNNNVASVTFNGTPLKKAASSFSNNDAEFWYMANLSGTGNIIVTMNGATQAVVGAYSFSGADQTGPIPTTATGHNTSAGSPAISITTKYPNDWILDLPSIWGGVTLGSPTCAQQWNVNVPNAITGASSSTTVPSPATVTCKWTASSADFWDDVAVELKAN